MSEQLSNRHKMYDRIAQVEDAQNRLDEMFADALAEVLGEHGKIAELSQAVRKRGLPEMVAASRAEAKMATWPDCKTQVSRRERMTQQATMYGIAALLERS